MPTTTTRIDVNQCSTRLTRMNMLNTKSFTPMSTTNNKKLM
eukprot:UN07693